MAALAPLSTYRIGCLFIINCCVTTSTCHLLHHHRHTRTNIRVVFVVKIIQDMYNAMRPAGTLLPSCRADWASPADGLCRRGQVLLVDGFGQLHQRGCGSASHLGVVCGLPTVGVGKTLVALDGLSERAVRSECAAAIAAQRERASQEGGGAAEAGREGPPPHCQQDLCLPLRGASGGAPLGMAVCKTGTSRPIFVSVGHRLSLPTATRLVLACSRHRVPEPIRQADLRSRAFIRERLPM